MGNNTQSNTQKGAKVYDSAADFTGKEGFLAKLSNSSGACKAAIAAAVGDPITHVVTEVISTTKAVLEPLDPTRTMRARLQGTCVPGDYLTPAAGGDVGKLIKLPASAGTYRIVGIAEESGADEQEVLFRPYGNYLLVVP